MKASELISSVIKVQGNPQVLLKGLDDHYYPLNVEVRNNFFGPNTEPVIVISEVVQEYNNHLVAQHDKINAMNEIVRNQIKPNVPQGMGFIFLMFDYGEKGNLFYGASAMREDCMNVMKEFIQRNTQ